MPRDILALPAPASDRRIAYGPDPLHYGDVRVPPGAGPHPVLIFVHGGFWRAQYTLDYGGHLCAALKQAGVATWNVEYRRVGNVGGGWPGTCYDVLQATQYLFEANLSGMNLDQVTIAGHSAGGHLALWVAAQHKLPLRKVVSLAGVTDLRRCLELGLGSGAAAEFLQGDASPDASPIELLPIQPPQVMVHGASDDIVPMELSERFCAASKNCRLVRLEGADHFDVIDPRSSHWPAVRASLLGEPPV